MPWIQTYTGRVFDYDDLEKYFSDPQACLTDICQSLSLINRYLGHTKFPYSVAHHSLNLAKYVPGHETYALLHDCCEAYLCDFPAPIKTHLTPEYKELEERINRAIYKCFNIPYPTESIHGLINNYDLMIRRVERKYLMEVAPIPWTEDFIPYETLRYITIASTDWEIIRYLFWREITKYVGAMPYPWPEPSIFSF